MIFQKLIRTRWLQAHIVLAAGKDRLMGVREIKLPSPETLVQQPDLTAGTMPPSAKAALEKYGAWQRGELKIDPRMPAPSLRETPSAEDDYIKLKRALNAPKEEE